MYEKCKSCFYEDCMDVCITCYKYSFYKNKNEKLVYTTSYNPLVSHPLGKFLDRIEYKSHSDLMWPKENPHLKNLCKVGDNVGTEDLRDKFKEIIDKRIKEIKERDDMKDFKIYEVTENYTNDGYEYVIKANSTTSIIRNLGEDEEITRRIVKDMLNSYYGKKATYGINSGYGITNNKSRYAIPIFKIKDVRFSGPATIVFWEDGTKTVVKAQDETIDYEKGLAMAIAKKTLGNKGKYFNEFKKWIPEEKVKEPNPIGKVVHSLFDEQGATFECTLDDVNTFKQLIATTDDGKTFNISFEDTVKEKD